MVILGFSVKLPVYLLHYWLPIAHVEAPTFGRVVLAGLLLKLGGCGLLRVSFSFEGLPLLKYCLMSYLLISTIYSVIACCIQADIKRLVAYSSVFHITFLLGPILCRRVLSQRVSLYLMITHGFVSPLIFFLVGLLYTIYGRRMRVRIGNLILLSPIIYIVVVLRFCMNVPTPPFGSFVGEVLAFLSLYLIFVP